MVKVGLNVNYDFIFNGVSNFFISLWFSEKMSV